jgi:hypothetical protein
MAVASLKGMDMMPHTQESTIPLPPSPLDPNARVMLFELTEGNLDEGWRIFQLGDGTYTFEVQSHNIVLLSEHHASFADASARVSRWYAEHFPARVA